MYISLFFDVEDCITPFSDQIAKDLAEILTANGVVADFLVTGEKARVLQQRGREDVIAALRRHAIGLHSNRHSRHPTVSEYLEQKGWEEGIAEAIGQEGPGVETIQQIFGVDPECWGVPGGSWGPQIHPAMRRLGVPAVVYPETYTPSSDVHWYCGVLTFGYRHFFEGFDFAYSNDREFQEKFGQFQAQVEANIANGFDWMGVFCAHPITVRALEFGDAINFGRGKETSPEQWEQPPLKSDAEYRTALANFTVLVAYVAAHAQLQVRPVRDLMPHFGQTPVDIDVNDLVSYAENAAGQENIVVDDAQMSPAEAVDIMARYLLACATDERPSKIAWRYVEGPLSRPPQMSSAITLSGAELLALCARVRQHIDETGQAPIALEIDLPASQVGGGSIQPASRAGGGSIQPASRAGGLSNSMQAGIGSLYNALCEAVLAQAAGTPLMQVTLRPAAQMPSIAEAIVKATHRGYRGWVIHKPDLYVENLLEYTRLQTWTLRRAAYSGATM